MDLYDLPNSCADLVESIELIVIAEKLIEGSKYEVNKWIDCWEIKFNENLNITIPIPISSYRPPFIEITIEKMNKIFNNQALLEFEQEIKDIKGLHLIKNSRQRGNGYLNLSGSNVSSSKLSWQIIFIEHSKIYDFYLLCKEKGIY